MCVTEAYHLIQQVRETNVKGIEMFVFVCFEVGNAQDDWQFVLISHSSWSVLPNRDS
jgi:hypothetical protein